MRNSKLIVIPLLMFNLGLACPIISATAFQGSDMFSTGSNESWLALGNRVRHGNPRFIAHKGFGIGPGENGPKSGIQGNYPSAFPWREICASQGKPGKSGSAGSATWQHPHGGFPGSVPQSGDDGDDGNQNGLPVGSTGGSTGPGEGAHTPPGGGLAGATPGMVPEPSSLAYTALGLFLLLAGQAGISRRRRSRQSA